MRKRLSLSLLLVLNCFICFICTSCRDDEIESQLIGKWKGTDVVYLSGMDDMTIDYNIELVFYSNGKCTMWNDLCGDGYTAESESTTGDNISKGRFNIEGNKVQMEWYYERIRLSGKGYEGEYRISEKANDGYWYVTTPEEYYRIYDDDYYTKVAENKYRDNYSKKDNPYVVFTWEVEFGNTLTITYPNGNFSYTLYKSNN